MRILRPPQVAKLKDVVREGVVKRGRSAPKVERKSGDPQSRIWGQGHKHNPLR